ncbi:MAG: SRPBCC domain-containing protein, partial [Planctomycetes bacterium]|nr:SRPBCC domain-containing protein [Planctomycetota bacterium]
GGGISANWTMKLAFPGGKYEEERKVILDGAFRLVAAGYVSDGETVSEARWTAEAPAPADSATAIIFLWAAMMPLEAGAVLVRTELNEAKGFESIGATRFTCEAKAEDGTFLVRMSRADGSGMPIRVSAEREVVGVDWGGGVLTVRAAESTEHLYRPPPPLLREVESPGDRLTLTGDFPKFSPAEMFDHFTKPDLLAKWWPPQAEVELEEGGPYVLTWPGQWRLLGRVLSFLPGRHLVFSWTFEHQPSEDRRVEVVFEPRDGGGTRLWVIHSPYGEGEAERKERAGHRKGWEHFLGKLAALRP